MQIQRISVSLVVWAPIPQWKGRLYAKHVEQAHTRLHWEPLQKTRAFSAHRGALLQRRWRQHVFSALREPFHLSLEAVCASCALLELIHRL